MTLTSNETTRMERHRIQVTASLMFDLVMPETATDAEIKARATLAYQNAVDDCEGFTLNCALPYCRVYVATIDELESAEIDIADTTTLEGKGRATRSV